MSIETVSMSQSVAIQLTQSVPQAALEGPARSDHPVTNLVRGEYNPRYRPSLLKSHMRQLRGLSMTLSLRQTRRGRRRRAGRTRRMRRMHRRLLRMLNGGLRGVWKGQRRPSAQATNARYGESLGGELNQILNSNMPFDQMLALFSAKIADHYENKMKETMQQMADSKSQGSSSGNKALDFFKKIFGGLAGGIGTILGGPALGAAISGGINGSGNASGSSSKDNEASLQAQLQFYSQRMKRAMEMCSNLSSSYHAMCKNSIDAIKRA